VETPTRSWFRIFAVATILLAVVAAGGVFIQSPQGFKTVVLPLAQRWSGGTLQAESGRFLLHGRLEVAGLSYRSSEGTLAGTVDQLVVSLDPFSFLLGDDPVVHELELVGAQLLSREAAHEHPPVQALRPASAPPQLIPLSIERARLRDVTVEVMRRDVVELRIGVADGSIQGLAPGRTARLEGTAEIGVAPDDPARGQRITAKLNLELHQASAGTDFEWEGRLDATVREGVQTGAVQSVVFSSATSGSYDDPGQGHGRFRMQASIDARRDATTIGSAVAHLAWLRGADANQIDAELKLSAITQDFLNPFLAPLGPARLASAQLEGTVDIRTEAGRTTFESRLTAKD
jgi:hypothetical protein